MKLESDEHLAKGGHRFTGTTSYVGFPPHTHPDVPDASCTANTARLGVHPILALSESHHSQSLLSPAGTGQATG